MNEFVEKELKKIVKFAITGDNCSDCVATEGHFRKGLVAAYHQALEDVRLVVPDEATEYTPPTFTTAKRVKSEEAVNGWNACREEVLKRLEELKKQA